MGKTEGIFLNLQCDCHRAASIFIKLINQRQFQHLAAIFDSAMNKWTLTHLPGASFNVVVPLRLKCISIAAIGDSCSSAKELYYLQ